MITRIISIFLAFNLLLSTSGLAVNSHYCSGKRVATAFFVNAQDCLGNTQRTPCEEDQEGKEDGFHQKKCCTDQSTFLRLNIQEEQTTTSSFTKKVKELDHFPSYQISDKTEEVPVYLSTSLRSVRPPLLPGVHSCSFLQVFLL